jgi:hypothetical protein
VAATISRALCYYEDCSSEGRPIIWSSWLLKDTDGQGTRHREWHEFSCRYLHEYLLSCGQRKEYFSTNLNVYIVVPHLVRGPELLSKWLGDSEKAVQTLFRRARAAAPSLVFFDEIDAFAAKR